MGGWGPGLYQDDDALDLRDRWRAYSGVGFRPADLVRQVMGEGVESHADETVFWLVLADLQWRAGWLPASVRGRALRIIDRGLDLHRWDEAKTRKQRARALDKLARQLRSPMPPARPIRPRHPCDWKSGERIVWRTVDGGSAVLRVVGFDARWGGGGLPVVEVIGACGPGQRPEVEVLAEAGPRMTKRGLPMKSGRVWRGPRFKIGVFEPDTYSGKRLWRVRGPVGAGKVPRIAGEVLGMRWNYVHSVLFRGFDIPWAPGAILRVPTAAGPQWLVVADVTTIAKEPVILAELLDWSGKGEPSREVVGRIDVRRTADTARIIRARVVDPRNRQSIAKILDHLGVRGLDEQVPLRVALRGYAPSGIEVVGRRKVVRPSAMETIIEWSEFVGAKSLEGVGRPGFGSAAEW